MKQITDSPPPQKPIYGSVDTEKLSKLIEDSIFDIYDKRTMVEILLCLSYFLEQDTPGSWQLLSVAGFIPNMSDTAVEQKFIQIFKPTT